jgi:hypothetical protein
VPSGAGSRNDYANHPCCTLGPRGPFAALRSRAREWCSLREKRTQWRSTPLDRGSHRSTDCLLRPDSVTLQVLNNGISLHCARSGRAS